MEKIRVGIVGTGWRAQAWLRLLSKLQNRFALAGVCCHGEAGAGPLRAAGVPVFFEPARLWGQGCGFVLVCVAKGAAYGVCRGLLQEGAAVLCETPAGTDEAECAAFAALGGRLQFAEQYPLLPRFAALRAAAERGMLGRVHTLLLSCCHGCHAAALARALLGTGTLFPQVRALRTEDAYVRIRGREGELPPALQAAERVLAVLRFGGKTALYDFSYPQYFSAIRRPRVLLQGTEGEADAAGGARIDGEDFSAFAFSYRRGGADDLAAPCLETVSCGQEVLYRAPFAGAPLSDEELAMGECLLKMQRFVQEGVPFYSPREAALDARIAAAVHAAAREGG